MFEAKAPIRPITQPKARAPTPPLSPPQVSQYITTPADLLRYVHSQEDVIDLTGDDETVRGAPRIEVLVEHMFEESDEEVESLELRLEAARERKRAERRREKSKVVPTTYDKDTLNF